MITNELRTAINDARMKMSRLADGTEKTRMQTYLKRLEYRMTVRACEPPE